jgi:hypothetical protein
MSEALNNLFALLEKEEMRELPDSVMNKLLTPPPAVQSAAKKGLELSRFRGPGLLPKTIQRARGLAAGNPVTVSRMIEMRAWFARHSVDKRPNWQGKSPYDKKLGGTPPTPGWVGWLMWGGDPARNWVISSLKRLGL